MKEENNKLTKSLRDVFITSSVEKLVQHKRLHPLHTRKQPGLTIITKSHEGIIVRKEEDTVMKNEL